MFSEGFREVIGRGERPAEEDDAVDGGSLGKCLDGEDGDARAAGLGDEMHGASGIVALIADNFGGDVFRALSVAIDPGEIGEIAAGEWQAPVKHADRAGDSAFVQAIAHGVGKDGFGFDSGEDEGETSLQEGGVQGSRLANAESSQHDELDEFHAETGVFAHFSEKMFGSAARGRHRGWVGVDW